MAMFDRNKGGRQGGAPAPQPGAPNPSQAVTPTLAAEKAAMIGKGIRVSGDVTAQTNLRVDGVVEGRSVKGEQDIEIGEHGKVVGNLVARVVKISGEVTGDIAGSEKVLISKTGRVQGNIVAPRVQLEDGALFRGSIDMNPVPPAEAKPAAKAEARSEARQEVQPAAAKAPVLEASARKEPGLTLKSG
jgi:cytoskeletal protein CcmA (bactofilin family)